jgi:hypothetical protein
MGSFEHPLRLRDTRITYRVWPLWQFYATTEASQVKSRRSKDWDEATGRDHTTHLLSKRCAIRIKTSDVFFRQRNLLAVEQELAAPADGTKGVHDKRSQSVVTVEQELAAPADGTKGVHDKRSQSVVTVEQELATPADGTKVFMTKGVSRLWQLSRSLPHLPMEQRVFMTKGVSRLWQNVQGKSSFASVAHYLLTYSTHGELLIHIIDDT